jgi:rubrerythrin
MFFKDATLKDRRRNMADFFKAADVVAAAVEMEKRGQAVYRRLALQATDKDVKALFENLAAEEQRHEELFSAMVRRVGQAELPASSTKDEYSQYMASLLDSHALFSPGMSDELFAQAGNLESAVRGAMKLEKDSMLFFQEMLKVVPQAEHPRVMECIDEERRHMRQLSSMLAK